MTDKIEIEVDVLVNLAKDIQSLKSDMVTFEKTSGNDINSVNRRLESLQNDISQSHTSILDKISDTITINVQKLQIEQEKNNKHLVTGLNKGIDQAQKDADLANEEVRFAKRLGYLFAAISSLVIGWLGIK